MRNTSTFISKAGASCDLANVTIETSRLTLKPITMEFAQVIFEEFTPDITRYMVPKSPERIEETKEFISGAIEQRAQGTDLILVILLKETQEFLGICGLHGRADPREPEFGIWLKKSAHGNRYGQEAIRFLRGWAVEALVLNGFVYPVDKANLASRKIPESLGGITISEQKASTMGGGLLDEVVYRIPPTC